MRAAAAARTEGPLLQPERRAQAGRARTDVRRARDAFFALVVAAAALVVPAHTAGAEVHIGSVPAGIDVLLGDYSRAWTSHDASLLDKTLVPGKLRDREL